MTLNSVNDDLNSNSNHDNELRQPLNPTSLDSKPGRESDPNDGDQLDTDREHYPVQHPSDIIGNWGPCQRNLVIFIMLIYMIAPLQVNHQSLCYLTDGPLKI